MKKYRGGGGVWLFHSYFLLFLEQEEEEISIFNCFVFSSDINFLPAYLSSPSTLAAAAAECMHAVIYKASLHVNYDRLHCA